MMAEPVIARYDSTDISTTMRDVRMYSQLLRRAFPVMTVCILCAVCVDACQADVVRFLVGESYKPFHNDSYVLPLSDSMAIDHARELIAMGPQIGEAIVVAKIAKGANGINRNYFAEEAPPWSWHVTEFESFSDSTIEILDGWPTDVENDVDGWIANTEGKIGFWQYSVVAELPAGDYDADLDVDADDLIVWRSGFGGIADLSADGNGNGVVDVADFIVWRNNLGARGALPRASNPIASVPEQSTLHLSLISAALVSYALMRRPLLH
jgi:hypothetical protein